MKPKLRLWTAGMWQRYNRIKKDKTSGFTLVELIVVLVVLGILCTLAVMGIMGWQDYADFKKQNEYAQSIFSAVQIQLTQYGERGQLTELIDAVTDNGKADKASYLLSLQKNLTDSNGISYNVDEDSVWQDGNKGSIYYLMVQKGDYEVYQQLRRLSSAEMKNVSASDIVLPEAVMGQNWSRARLRRIRALYDMIDPYISDKSMLDAAICVEFDPNPKTALVYSVFYNQNVAAFTYGSHDTQKGAASIADRKTDSRKKDKTGYYGAEIMSRGTDTFISRPVITNVRLNNEETLNLTWSTKGNGNDLVELIYNINIIKAEEKQGDKEKVLMSLEFGSLDVNNLDTLLAAHDNRVECIVRFADGSNGKYWFPMIHDVTEDTLKLVLDGLDLSAGEDMDVEAESAREVASIHRFLMQADSIYAVISGARKNVYDLTVEKRSNSEHQMFGSSKILEDGSIAYGIENVRHLNNIRYKEKEYENNDATTGSPVLRYQVIKDINWEYALNQGTVYTRGIVQWPENGIVRDYYFRPLSALRKNSFLETDDTSKTRILKRFRMDIDHMEVQPEARSNTTIGLIESNKGTIQNLILEDISVNGVGEKGQPAAATGGFCGQNSGTLYNLTVRDSGLVPEAQAADYNQINGFTYVGGIMGKSVEASSDIIYEKLINRIPVTGQQYVGGIAGRIQSGHGNVTVRNCENYGQVRGKMFDSDQGAYFFGGIAGRTDTANGFAGMIRILECTSSPYYTEEDANVLLEAIQNGSDVLIETFAGGIVGFNDGADIDSCNTLREAADKKGYIVGKDYVGGIVGYNSGRTGKLTSGLDNNRNQIHVIGHSYVGGIVGCNAIGILNDETEPYSITLIPESALQGEQATIVNWVNEGIIVATGNYVGGITGYNGETGLIDGSYSNTDYNAEAEKLSRVTSNARFAGGIAGYNKGDIKNTSGTTMAVVSVVSGQDYIGGVVGCNDIGGIIENYVLTGGYIDGKNFVGGFVGLNLDKGLFSNSYSVLSSPNRINGNYFVGGIIGANLVPVEEQAALTADFRTDNFLGTLSAEHGAFAGGFIGYNYLLKESAASFILDETDALCNELKMLSDEEDVTAESPENRVMALLSGYANTTAHLDIRGSGENGSATQELLGSIRAKIYVGGVVGYNHADTKLTIQNVENITPVEAGGYITKKEGDMEAERNYSYAGGIIGKVEQNVILDNCRNRDVGEVRTKGTYTGGLAEINYGTIQNCQAGNIGDGTGSYIGGVVGVNASKTVNGKTVKGILTNCSLSGQVSGLHYVGGLAAENYGIIRYNREEDTHDAVVDANGRYVGGITGYAHKGGQITIESDVKLNIDVTGSGTYVGGITGVNAGSIEVSEGRTIENTKNNTVIGHKHVGGFIGMQVGAERNIMLRGFLNRAHVQASAGYAGGIVAVTAGKDGVTIQECENYGTVEVLTADDDEEDIFPEEAWEGINTDSSSIMENYGAAAGGITALNYGTISHCGNYGEVQAGSGYMGGIAAINYRVIKNSESGPDGGNDMLELTGDLYVGGIAAINESNATIQECLSKNLILRNQSESTSGYMGGIAAQNKENGIIRDCYVGVNFDAREAVYKKDDNKRYSGLREEASAYVSAGIQNGKYSLEKSGENRTGNFVKIISDASDVMMGGVAGQNDGKIEGGNRAADAGYSVVAADLRFVGESMNYYGNIGGVAGWNGGKISGYEFSGYVCGEANNPAKTPGFNNNYDLEPTGSRVYGYGGIAGVNGSDLGETSAAIKNCYLGMARIRGTGAGSNRSNVGGVAGFNGIGASIADVVFSQKEDVLTSGQSMFSYNDVYTNPTNDRSEGTVWVLATDYGHVGGVAGYNYGDISNINWSRTYQGHRNEETSGRGYFPDGRYTAEALAEVDSSWVLITDYAGHVGGIVGFNRRTGRIFQAVTGRNWLVHAATQAQDNGTGGIIGYNISERDLEQCDNHATVVKLAGNAVGGMVGRQENGTSNTWRFYNCRNYGNIHAAARGAGFIGNWKYKGGTLEQCVNYGTIRSGGNDGVGGMVALVYQVASGDIVSLINCENHGRIVESIQETDKSAEAVGGMMGKTNSNGTRFRFHGCVNTGFINGKNSSAGIIGSNGNTPSIIGCRNYGYGSANFVGITSVGANMSNCFGVTGDYAAYPLKKSKVTENYYFSDKKTDEWGTALSIVNHDKGNQAISSGNKVLLENLGDYTWADINNSKRANDSSLSYQLCKGIIKADGTKREGLDGYLVLNSGDAIPPVPTNLKKSDVNGEYKISWNQSKGSQYYEVRCRYQIPKEGSNPVSYDVVETTYTTYMTECIIPRNIEKDGEKATGVKVSVRACSGEKASDFSSELNVIFGIQLPFPQIQWRLDGKNGSQYFVSLANRQEYVRFVKENLLTDGFSEEKLKAELGKIKITTTGLELVSFTAETGGSDRGYSTNSSGNIRFTNYAEYTGGSKVERSVNVIRESVCPPWDTYNIQGNNIQGKKLANAELEKTNSTNGVGFSGTTAKELTYNVKLSKGGVDWGLNYRTELMADDPELGIPVAFSVSEETRISPTSSGSIAVRLANLPEDFLKKDQKGEYSYQNVMVRAYPAKMSNDIVYQGWEVSEDIYNAEDLLQLQVTGNGELAKEGDSDASDLIKKTSTVADGYVIVWEGQDSNGTSQFKLYYNALLRRLQSEVAYKDNPEQSSWKYDKGKSTYMKYHIFYHKILLEEALGNRVQPEPVIYAAAEYDPALAAWKDGNYDGTDEFVLTWDQAALGSVPAYTGSIDEANYKNAIYRLTIVGRKGDTQTTLVNNQEFTTAERTGSGYNTYIADSSKVKTWDYDMLIITMTRLGTEDSNGILTKYPSTVTKELKMRKRLSQVKDVTVSLKKDENGIALKDGLDYVVSFAGVPDGEERDALKHYKLIIASRETEKPSAAQEILTDAPMNATQVEVKLNTFRRNEKIAITVQAISKDDGKADHSGYRDGLVSAAAEMTVPNRLIQPQMGKPTGGEGEANNLTEHDYKALMSVEEFKAGCITLRMAEENYGSVDYHIALNLYDSREEAVNNDSPIDTAELLPTKETPVEMIHESARGYYSYTLKNLPTDYAGKWLKVVLRSVGDSNISSVWTDEVDEGNPDITVEPYLLFQLPDVRVNAVTFDEPGTENVICRILKDGEAVEGSLEVTATQIVTGFEMAEHSDSYRIHMIQTLQQADRKATGSNASPYTVSDVNQMTLTKQSDDKYQLVYWTTEGADAGKQPEMELMLEIGGEAQELLYQEAIPVSKNGHYIQTAATIRLDRPVADGPVHVIFRLPDCEAIRDGVSSDLGVQKRTEQILVQSVAEDGNEHYKDSAWAIQSWSDDELRSSSTIELRDDTVSPDYVDTGAQEASNISDVAYILPLTGTTRYLAYVYDSKGKKLGVFGVPVYKTAAIGTMNQQLWFPESFATPAYAGEVLNLQFQSIFDAAGTNGGLSQNLTPMYRVELPGLSEATAVSVAGGIAGESQYPVTFTKESSNPVLRRVLRNRETKTTVITARQKQLVWEHDLQDTKTSGYRLELKGSDSDSQYQLDIDLHRGLFGVMPGLEEYLEADGKRLYTVSYHVDGDILLKLEGDSVASPSDAGVDPATSSNAATGSNIATASDSQAEGSTEPGVLTLECTLKAEYVTDDEERQKIRFTLKLPDLSYDYMPENAAKEYAEAFPEGLYQTEEFQLTPLMVNRYYRREETVLDLTDMRGELENDLQD